MHARCAGACLHVIVCMCVAWVRVRMFVCAGVFARVRAHAHVFMRGWRVYVRSRVYVSQDACVSARARP